MKKSVKFFCVAGAVLLTVATAVFAAVLNATTFGEATDLGGGSYRLTSDNDPGFGGLNYNVPVPIKFSDITVLRTLQTAEPDDTCVGGSPRFQLNVDTDGDDDSDGNVFVYTQSFPSGCPADTGDLAETGGPGDVPGAYDTSHFIPGTQVSTYTATADFFAANPTYRIIGIQVVVDSSFAFGDGEQTITVTPTVEVNLPQPANANACKNGGWRTLFRPNGSSFKNQGDCIQFVNTGK